MKTKYDYECMAKVVDDAFTGNLIEWSHKYPSENESRHNLFIYDHEFNWKLIDYRTIKNNNFIEEEHLYVDEYRGKLVFRLELIRNYNDGHVQEVCWRMTNRYNYDHYKSFQYDKDYDGYMFNKGFMSEILK